MTDSNIIPVTPLELIKLLNQRELLVVDVREVSEYQAGHIEGAINVPLSELKGDIDLLDTLPGQEIVLVCQRGVRSLVAGQLLQYAGKAFVTYNLERGMWQWQQDGLPISLG